MRTSEYLQALGELAAQGSFEPGEYIGESAKLWSNVVGEIGDWMKPESGRLDPPLGLISLCRGKVKARSGTRPVTIDLPVEVFAQEADDAVILLSTDGLLRRFEPRSAGRPVLLLEPERNLRLHPNQVSKGHPRSVELKVFDVPDTILAGEVYEGLVWGTVVSDGRRLPVAAVEVTIV